MKSFLVGLQFLTRIKLVKQTNWVEEDFGRSVKFFPLYGAVIGVILAAGYYICSLFLPPLVTAVCLLALEVYITGGIHLDGFMDTMDGMFSGRTPERMLEIMKDSRVGAHSVIALGLLQLLKFSMYYEFPAEMLLPALIVTPVMGRWAMAMGITQFPYARPAGMGKSFHQHAGRSTLPWASLFAAASAAVLGWMGAAVVVVSAAWAFLFCHRVSKQLGGLTGDVYGAAAELTQVVTLLAAYLAATAVWPYMLL